MSSLFKIILLTLFFAMILTTNSVLAPTSEYDFSGFAASLSLTETGIPFNFTGNCNAQMASTNTFASIVTFDSTITWRSPDASVLGFSTLSGIFNTSCLSYGQTSLKSVSRDGSSSIYEASWDVTHSAVSGFVNTQTRYTCDSPVETTTFKVTRDDDSRGECQWIIREINSDNHVAFITALENSYNRCGDLSSWLSIKPCANVTTAFAGLQRTTQYIYPINSSATGNVNFSFTDASITMSVTGGTPTFDYYIDIINTETQTTTNVHTTTDQATVDGVLFSIPDVTGTISLTPDSQYLWVVTFNKDVPGGFTSKVDAIDNPIMELEIFTFRPQYICGEFGECINATQSRVCVDQFGVAPDRIEVQSCFDVPAHEIDLGFEAIVDLFPPDIYICQLDWTIIGCPINLNTIPARFPVNWTISADADFSGTFRQNYIRISEDTATVGTKSLQMNYIPPKIVEPISDPGNASLTVCGNKTIGDFPFVTTGLNQTRFVAINVSFPTPFIQIRLDARKCSNPVLQYDYTGDIFSICDVLGVFRKVCYATNCTDEPGGNYRVGVFDAQTLEQIVEFTDTAINSWISHIIDLSNAGLLVNHNYTIILVVNPEIVPFIYDPQSHCVYFDNFRITVTEAALPECVTKCEGLDLFLATQNGDVCFFTQVTNSPQCAPDETTAEAFQDFETICIGTVLHFFNNVTGLWDLTTDSDICIAEQAAIEEGINITSPLPDTVSNIEFFSFIFSPIFLYIIFSLIVSGILSAGIARVTKNGDGTFQVFGVTMLIFVLLGSLPGIAVIPIWISVAIIAVISLLIAQKLRNFGFPGGGG